MAISVQGRPLLFLAPDVSKPSCATVGNMQQLLMFMQVLRLFVALVRSAEVYSPHLSFILD
jgi:hypothetical protein